MKGPPAKLRSTNQLAHEQGEIATPLTCSMILAAGHRELVATHAPV